MIPVGRAQESPSFASLQSRAGKRIFQITCQFLQTHAPGPSHHIQVIYNSVQTPNCHIIAYCAYTVRCPPPPICLCRWQKRRQWRVVGRALLRFPSAMKTVKQTLNTWFGWTCVFRLEVPIKLTQTKKSFPRSLQRLPEMRSLFNKSSTARPFSPQPERILVHTRSPWVIFLFSTSYEWPSSSL